MSPLMKAIRRRIETTGPMNIATYMAECLCHPEHGYYMKLDPFGQKGDFITAPEVSQTFGELVGLWAAITWQLMGSPASFHLIELGPGRGTLMSDALRAAKGLPGFLEAANIELVEISPALKARQKETLKDYDPKVTWHASISDLPQGPSIIIANEFFDALPLRQFEKGDKGWSERFVDIDPDGEGLRYVLQPDKAAFAFMPDQLRGEEGKLFEVNTVARTQAHELGRRLSEDGGAALVIDYGYSEPAFGETFQAIKNHQYTDPLLEPGEADLTAHVDFASLAQAFLEGGTNVYGPTPQGAFLGSLGLGERTDMLLKATPPDMHTSLLSAYRRLTHPEEMGTLFKVLVATQVDMPVPAGFEE